MQEIDFRKDILPLRDKLYRLALRITLNSAEAEDIVQDTLLRVWNRRDEWSTLSSVEAYRYTIARNLALDRRELADSRTVELTPEAENSTENSGPYDRMISQEQLDIIHSLVNRLPEKQRTVMQLRDIEGKSYREIADLMQFTEEQVKTTLFRARKKIRQQYLDIDGYGL